MSKNQATLKDYYYLAKPGIVRGNALSLLAGYFLAASMYGFDWVVFLATLIGSSLVIASGCVFNNYLDRGLDAKMDRTKTRALVTHVISGKAALVYGSILGAIGLGMLWFLVNPLTTLLGAIGLVWYVFIYGFAKRTTPWSTLIGTVCGAIPPVAGYTAVAGQIDSAAIILFLILVAWQMPHFYAVAIKRADQYKAAGIPLLPLVHGAAVTKRQMIAYMIAFLAITPLLTIAGYTGKVYLAASVALATWWLMIAIRTWNDDDKKWSGRIFGTSLLVLLIQSALIAAGNVLP